MIRGLTRGLVRTDLASNLLGWDGSPASYRAQVLSDSPIAYWGLDETSGTTAVDLMGNRNGTYFNTPTLGKTPATAGLGKSVGWNRSSFEYMGFAHTAALSNWTAEAWVKLSGAQSLYSTVICDTYSSSLVNFYLGFWDTSNGLTAGYFSSGWKVTPVHTLTAGVWYHVAGTYDGATVRLYVDGVEVQTLATATAALSNNAGGIVGRNWAAGAYYNGDLDEVALYGTALSADRIAAHYAARLF